MLFVVIELSKIQEHILKIDLKDNIKNDGISNVSSFAISLLNLAKIPFAF
jgi:hypothetical protein